MRFYDVLAGLMALILLVAIVGLVFLERDIPNILDRAFTLSLGFVFKSIVDQANGFRERRNNRGPT